MVKETAINPNQKIQIGDPFVSDRNLKEMTDADIKETPFFPQIRKFFRIMFISFIAVMKKMHLY